MASIDGLSSGLDTTSIIKQLMQLERQPQVRLQSRQTATEASIQSLRSLNAKFLTIGTATSAFGAVLPKPTPPAGSPPVVTTPAKPTDWQLTKAASSDASRVSVAAVAGAAAGTLRFNVEQLAQASSSLGSKVYSGTGDTVSASGDRSLTLTKGDQQFSIETRTGTLAETVAAINSSAAGVAATTVQVEPGKYQLQLTSTTTGADTAITLSDGSGALAFTETAAGKDALLVLAGGTTVRRSSNTLSDVLDGVTLTLTKADTATTPRVGTTPPVFTEAPVSVTVTKDTDAVVAKVQALVDAANAARTEAKTLTAADPVSKTKGRLYGDSSVRSLVDRVRTAVSGDTAGAALAGVTVTRDGTVELDKTKLLAALEKDPTAVEAALGKDGLAGRLHKLADDVTRSVTAAGGAGVITNAITSRERQVERFADDIAGWDARLAVKEKQLQRTYTSLETALGKARSQGQWLSGQLASLPTYGSS